MAGIIQQGLERVASGRFSVPLSLALTGVPDFTGTIPEGEVVLMHEGQYCEEEILLYRNPGTHTGDVRKVRARLPTAGKHS